jgi:hypothetical protein
VRSGAAVRTAKISLNHSLAENEYPASEQAWIAGSGKKLANATKELN